MAPSQKINLKDKVEDGEIDLSMCDLQEVPVKDIAIIKNIFSLDLSNNHLTILPKTFASLTFLTKLDLSKNSLKELPENFGDLVKLKHLDLYRNELQHLPLSFGKLKALKWLDLKDNPLVPAIKDTAGPCLDSKQCQVCAKNIVQFYTEFQEKVAIERDAREKQRQKDKLANEVAAQKQKLLEKKNKKKEKVKQRQSAGDMVLEEKDSTDVNALLRDSEPFEELKMQRKPSILPKVVRLFLAMSLSLLWALFILTSVKVSYTEGVAASVRTVWNSCVNGLPPAWQYYAEEFGTQFRKAHEITGEGVLLVFNYVEVLRNNENVNTIMKKIEIYYNNLKETVVKKHT